MRKIPLTQGQYAIVDDMDYKWLSQWKWCTQKYRTGDFYATRHSSSKNGNRHTISMARQILELELGDKRQADHINHITLDNKRSNLRICTHSQNQRNQKSKRGTTSGYKGVYWNKQVKKWRVQIWMGRERKHLGLFNSEKEAAFAYNKAARGLFGEFAYLNLI